MTYQQKDDFVKKLERTALLTIVASVCSALVLSIGMFFYMRFQIDQNTAVIKELQAEKADIAIVNQQKETNEHDHAELKQGVHDLKSGQDRIFNFLLDHKK